VEYLGDRNFLTSHDIKNCMNTGHVFQVGLLYVLDGDWSQVFIDDQSVLYTGDFHCTPDRHLGAYRLFPQPTPLRVRPLLAVDVAEVAARPPHHRVDLRDHGARLQAPTRERLLAQNQVGRRRQGRKALLKKTKPNEKVLVPVFALGRAQELFILVERFWERFGLKHPIYFTTGLADKATAYYKLFINWTNETLRDTFTERNAFNFKFIKVLDPAVIWVIT